MIKPGFEKAGSSSVLREVSRPQTQSPAARSFPRRQAEVGSVTGRNDANRKSFYSPENTRSIPVTLSQPSVHEEDGQAVVVLLKEPTDFESPRTHQQYRFVSSSDLLRRLVEADDIMDVVNSTSYTDLVWDESIPEEDEFEQAWHDAKRGDSQNIKRIIGAVKSRL